MNESNESINQSIILFINFIFTYVMTKTLTSVDGTIATATSGPMAGGDGAVVGSGEAEAGATVLGRCGRRCGPPDDDDDDEDDDVSSKKEEEAEVGAAAVEAEVDGVGGCRCGGGCCGC